MFKYYKKKIQITQHHPVLNTKYEKYLKIIMNN